MRNVTGIIFLVGLPGVGKTTVGQLLADHLSYRFEDTDWVVINRTGVDIPTIFDVEGEAGFRQREHAVLKELSLQDQVVVATGGGIVLRPDNRQILSSYGQVVYLHATADVLLRYNISDKSRPLLQVPDKKAKIEQLYIQRDTLYREVADYIVDVEVFSLKKLVSHLASILIRFKK